MKPRIDLLQYIFYTCTRIKISLTMMKDLTIVIFVPVECNFRRNRKNMTFSRCNVLCLDK